MCVFVWGPRGPRGPEGGAKGAKGPRGPRVVRLKVDAVLIRTALIKARPAAAPLLYWTSGHCLCGYKPIHTHIRVKILVHVRNAHGFACRDGFSH